jgi:hypothetical protein
MTDFEVNDASGWCFDFAENSEVTLSSGSMNGCDLGAIHNVRPSPGGSLILENIDIVDAKGDLLDVEFDSVWISNVSATLSAGTTLTSANAGLTSAGKGATSSFYAYNFSAPDYGTFTVWALESVDMEDIDLGTATVNIYPGGTSSSAAGPSGSGASIVNLEAGNVNLVRISPSLDNLTIGLLTMMGNSPSSDMMIGKNWNTTGFTIGAAGYNTSYQRWCNIWFLF